MITLGKMKEKAFTLAEVLITLGIIGVVAALTIPLLINNYQKQTTVVSLKKAYTTLAQAIKLSEIDNGPNSTWNWSTAGDAAFVTNAFNTYFAPYLKIDKVCATCAECGYVPSANCWSWGLNGTSNMLMVTPATRATAILSDGSYLVVQMSSGEIVIDINGYKPPNIYGKDIFFFVLDAQKGLMPKYYNSGSIVCDTSNGGSGCAKKIITDGWEIKDDYPW